MSTLYARNSRAAIITIAFMIAALIGIGVCMPSCALLTPRGQVDASAIRDTVLIVVERHDKYVEADAALDDGSKSAALEQSASLLSLVQKDSVSQTVLKLKAQPVCDRHDEYVDSDASLTDLQHRVYHNSTDVLRAVWNAGK